MKFNQFRDIVAIVEHGSLRAAARYLGMPQPALTRSVRALEKELGAVLFERESTGMTLTSLGTLFYRRARTVVNEVERARDELAQTQGGEQGSVVAGMSIMPHVGMLPNALAAFRQRYPLVRLQIVEGLFPDHELQLRNGTLDFYLGAAPRAPAAPGLATEHWFDNRRAVVARRGHPLAGATSLAALAQAQWATTSLDYNAQDDLTKLFHAHALPAPPVLLQVRSALSMMVALAYSDLLALLPLQWVAFPLTQGAFVSIAVEEPLPGPPIVLITRPDLPLTPAADFLCDVLRREAPGGG